MVEAKTIDELLDELVDIETNSDFDLNLSSTWIRYAYGHAYRKALEDPEPLSYNKAHRYERAAWAQLPA